MKKKFYVVAFLATGVTMTYAQVGINNESPKATLDITAKKTDGSAPEGVIAPRLTGDVLSTAETGAKYGTAQAGTIVYVTAAATTQGTGQTQNVTAAGYYYFDGSKWQKFSTATATVAAKNVTVQPGDYTALPTDDIILLTPTANGFTLTLPTTGVPIGKTYYINNETSNGVTLLPLPIRDLAYPQSCIPQGSKVMMYVGGTGSGSYINLTAY
ncbi:hypothetical protein [Chryseobacterium limigenitum]|uniref:Uncharacterized protein n=1 Tax=Chryseobacterium limigenitum TaxID=1612149 RepID=A0A1K2IXX1_9FLAO|nr:hypothetical protein [Chryseobacterium limigenitum]SFZ97040.1 hypothetical protein SAMN05216324_13512 [Chryseobacterium limigenitum]